MTPLAMLMRAHALIAHPNRWCRDHVAQNSLGCAVAIIDPTAIKFCTQGAIDRIAYPKQRTPAHLALKRAAKALGYDDVPEANDEGGHAIAVRMFEFAMKEMRNA